jgi:hypothetical protein
MDSRDRSREWFVPAFGPPRFRAFIGLLFLPYTGMVLAYVAIGSMLAETIYWDRVAALLAIYFLALGIGAHALDAIGGSAGKPWGRMFTRAQLWTLAAVSIIAAYVVGVYYMILYVPLLWPIAIAEGFFVFAYNLEWFKGRFHTDNWFAVSWGGLPVLAGYVMQTNSLSFAALIVAAGVGLLSLVEIKASRPYKELKRAGAEQSSAHARTLEAILKCVSGGVILLGIGMAAWRWFG